VERQIAEIGLAPERIVVSGWPDAFVIEHSSISVWIFVELLVGPRSDGCLCDSLECGGLAPLWPMAGSAQFPKQPSTN
jgi:hypothetical protein